MNDFHLDGARIDDEFLICLDQGLSKHIFIFMNPEGISLIVDFCKIEEE